MGSIIYAFLDANYYEMLSNLEDFKPRKELNMN